MRASTSRFAGGGASRNKIFAYTLDRLSYSYSVTRSRQRSPRQDSHRFSNKSQFNYDLNFTGSSIFTIPLLRYKFRYLPSQLTFGSIWSKDETEKTSKFEDGTFHFTERSNRLVQNNSSLTWSVARNLRFTFSVASARDPNRRRLITDDTGIVVSEEEVSWLGINWGPERSHSERFSANYTPLFPVAVWFKPDISFTGSYNENLGVSIRRTRNEIRIDPDTGEEEIVTVYLDPENVRHLSGSGDVTVRGEVNLGGFFKRILGTGQESTGPRAPAATRRREANRVDRRRRGTSLPEPPAPVPEVPATADSSQQEPAAPQGGAEADSLTTGAELDATGQENSFPDIGANPLDPGPGSPSEEWPPQDAGLPTGYDSEPPPEEPSDHEASEGVGGENEEGEEGVAPDERRLDPGAALAALFRPFATVLREFQPVRVSYNHRQDNSYQHASDRANWAYRLAVSSEPGVSGAGSRFDAEDNPIDSEFSSYRKNDRKPAQRQHANQSE